MFRISNLKLFIICLGLFYFFSCKNKKVTEFNNNREVIASKTQVSGIDNSIEPKLLEGENSFENDNETKEIARNSIIKKIDNISNNFDTKYLSSNYKKWTASKNIKKISYHLKKANEQFKEDKIEEAIQTLEKINDSKNQKYLNTDDLIEILSDLNIFKEQFKKNLNCQARYFIEYLYDYRNNNIFFELDKEHQTPNTKRYTNCFLRGTFIFEDKEGKVFKLLAGDKAKNCSKYVYLRTSHSSVITKVAKSANSKIELYHLNEDTWKAPSKFRGLEFYEVVFDKPLEVSCKVKDGEEDEIKQNKGVAVLSRFKIITDDGKVLEYTFLKLESHEAMSVAHLKDAAKSYIFTKSKKKIEAKEGLILRKERKAMQIESSLDDYHIKKEYEDTFSEKSKIEKSCEAYDEYARTGNEFFIPQTITDKVYDGYMEK